jgi:hypothetical protein
MTKVRFLALLAALVALIDSLRGNSWVNDPDVLEAVQAAEAKLAE